MGGSEIEGGIRVWKDVCSKARVDLGALPDMAHGVLPKAPTPRKVGSLLLVLLLLLLVHLYVLVKTHYRNTSS